MFSHLKKPVICIVGPTATGKSNLGVEIARKLSTEVVSADSMQIYRDMDIGTAKLTQEEMKGVVHHLVDVIHPDERFSVAEWADRAYPILDTLIGRGKVPIVVGGTGLYIRAITDDLDFARQVGNEDVRARWEAYANAHGRHALHEALRERDPDSADRLHENDVRRVIRALEVFELRSVPMSEQYDWGRAGKRYQPIMIGLFRPRELLYERVNRRVDLMMRMGLYEEVRGLLARGYDEGLTSMQAIGYKEVAAAIRGEVSVEQAVDNIKRATRRFVKRQLSWFMRDSRIVWCPQGGHFGDEPKVDEVLKTIMRISEGFPLQESE